MRSLSLRFLVALSILLVPVFAFATNVTVSGTTTFAALDGGPNDADHTANGVFTVNGDLTINGKITCNSGGDDDHGSGCSMKFAVSGNLVMNAGSSVLTDTSNGDGNAGNVTFTVGGDTTIHGPFSNQSGALISGSVSNGGDHSAAGNITITSGGKITTESGSVISAASKQGASGKIVVTAAGKIDLSGLVASGPSASLLSTRLTGAVLNGGNSQQHGGEIRIQSNSLFEPGITIGSNATIVSQGETTAAGPVTLEGCGLIIKGLVAAVLDKEGVERVVLRSGKGMTIDATDLGVTGATTGRLGHVRADSLGNWQSKEEDDEENNSTAPSKTVDLFSNDAIQVLGPDPSLSALYAVTSVPDDKDHKQDGGRIRAISLRGTVTGSGRVFLAGEDSDSNNGGTIAVSSMGNVNLDHGYLSAIGDSTKLKKDSSGGNITARSYSGNVIWTLGRGDVRPVGSGASGVAAQGTIALTACGTVSISGTTFPSNGPIAGVFPTIVTGSCSPTAPSLPAGEPSLPVCCNVITITNPAVASGPAGVPFSQTFTQTGAIGAATFSLASGALPTGLSLATNGTLSGTPTVVGTFPITVKVTDSQGCTGVGPIYNLQIVCPTITVTNPAVSSGVAAAPFTQTFTESGGVGATTFSLASGTLPAGLSLSSSGTLSGTPTQTGTFPITVKATDANGCTGTGATYTLTITCQTITVTNPAVSSGVAGTSFSQAFTQSGGIGTTTFSLASGSLPAGLVLAASGTLSGTPTQTGSFPITVKATDSNGCNGTGATYTLTIACPTITVTNPGVSSGVAGTPFSQTFTQSGGIGTMTFSLASGSLPAGLVLAANGTLSGTPTQTGSFPITVKATDSNGCTGTGATYTLVIACQNVTVTNPAVTSGVAGSPFSQTFTQSGGIGTTIFSIASGTLPAGLALAANGTLAGTPTQTGTFTITVKATDSNGCNGTGSSYTLTIVCQTITVTNPAVTSGVAGSPFSQTFSQSGAIGTATFTLASGTLPAGLSLSSAGVLAGTPTQTGTFPITVKVTDSNGCTGTSATYHLTITCQTITVTAPGVNGGVAGSPFNQTFTQSGAIGTATFSLASGTLPAGISLSSAGVLSGTPVQTGSFPITVKVTDSNGCTGTTGYTLTIACQTITVTPPGVNSGVAATPFSQTFTESGVIGTAMFTTSSTLPAGLSLSTSGVLSGTPTQTGTFPITVTATDQNGCSGSASYTLTIACQTITVTPPSVTTGVIGTPFSQSFTQSGAIGTATFSLASGSLPAGMSLAADGTLSGTPLQVGSFPIAVTVTDQNGCTGTSATYALVITCQTITVTPPAVMNGTVGTPFSQQYTQNGGIGTVTFSLTAGTLPTGMSLAADGTLSGTPSQSGAFPITVTATDSNGCTGSDTSTLTISCQTITVTNPGVTTGTAGTPFSQTFTQMGGIGTTTFSLASGSLPAGLTLAANGVLSGTPTQTGSFMITVKATDSNGCQGTGSTYTLVINCQTVTVTNPAQTSVQAGVPLNVTFTATGILGTATWSEIGSLPSGITLNSSTGVLSGTASSVGSFPITVQATDSNGCFGTSSYTLTVTCPTITITRVGGGSFPAATYNVGYPAGNQFQASCTGCTGTIHWAFQSGAQPPGINLTIVAGTLSGIPSATGTFTMTVTATDTGTGCSGSASFPFTIKPNVANDSYSNLVNNTQAYVTGGTTTAPATPAVQLSGTIVSNDTPASGVTVDASSIGTFSTTQGGSVTIAADGTFKYTPPVTASALSSDTFTYTGISNTGTVPSIPQYAASTGPATSTGTVTLNLANRVWYVKNDVGGGNGQSQSPYGSLGLAVGASTANDIIFVYRGDGTANGQSSGIILKNGQLLIGQGVSLVVNGNLLVSAGTAPLIGNGAGNVVTLATGNSVEGVTINATTGAGMVGAGITSGTTTVSSVTVTATGSNNGVSLSSNTGSTFNFSGIAITSATGTGLVATGGGTVNATGAGNAIAATGGTALNVTNTSIGASGLTFGSIAATGGTSGIVLNNTGASGGLTVTGDGSSDPANATRGNTTAKLGGGTITIGSGGTIQNTTQSGILLTNTNSVSLTSMKVLNAGGAAVNSGNNGITATTVSGLVLDNVLITGSTGNSGLRGTSVTNLQMQHTNINGNGTVAGTELTRNWNVRLDDLAGSCGSTCNWQNSLFFNSRSNVVGLNQGVSVTAVNVNTTITNSEFRDNTTGHASPGNDAFIVTASNSAVTNLTVTGSTFKNVELGGFQYNGNDNSGGTVNVRNSVFELNGSDVLLAHGGGSGGNATLNFDVSGNTMRQLLSPNSSVSVNVFLGGLSGAGSLMSGTIKNNTIGNAGVTNSGSVVGDGIDLNATGAGTITTTITGNTVHQIQFGDAFFALADNGSAKLNLFVHSNSFNTDGTAGNSLAGIDLISGAGSDTSAMCVDMALNVANGDAFYQGATLSTFGGVGATIKLLGLNATFNNNATALANFIGSNGLTTPPGVNSSVNPTPTVGGGAITISGGGTIVGTTSCGSFPP